MFLATLMISFRRGTPRVTFLEEMPALWKVFRVIWVAGSPRDYAAMGPTISPGFTMACSKRDLISPMIQSKASVDKRSVWIMFLVQSIERK